MSHMSTQPPYPSQAPYPVQAPYPPQGPYAPQQPPPPGAPTQYAPGSAPPPEDFAYGGYQSSPSGPPPPYPGNYTTPSSYPQGDNESGEPTVGFAARALDDRAIRRAFIRKVYLILLAQLLVTGAFICVFLFVKPVKMFVQRTPALYYVSYAMFLVTYIALACCPNVRRRFPANFIALTIFTLVFSYMVGTIASFYDTPSVLIAVGITAGLCLAISLFAMFTKIDFTLCSGVLLVLSVGLFLFGLTCIIVWQVAGYNYILQAVYGGLAAVVFGLFLAYDTQVVLGGKRYELSEEEYIFGALQLYLDVVYLFLIVLSLFGNKN